MEPQCHPVAVVRSKSISLLSLVLHYLWWWSPPAKFWSRCTDSFFLTLSLSLRAQMPAQRNSSAQLQLKVRWTFLILSTLVVKLLFIDVCYVNLHCLFLRKLLTIQYLCLKRCILMWFMEIVAVTPIYNLHNSHITKIIIIAIFIRIWAFTNMSWTVNLYISFPQSLL